jgi:hypothetical protein
MHYGSYDTDASEVTLTPPTISYRKFVTRNGDKPMNLQGYGNIGCGVSKGGIQN